MPIVTNKGSYPLYTAMGLVILHHTSFYLTPPNATTTDINKFSLDLEVYSFHVIYYHSEFQLKYLVETFSTSHTHLHYLISLVFLPYRRRGTINLPMMHLLPKVLFSFLFPMMNPTNGYINNLSRMYIPLELTRLTAWLVISDHNHLHVPQL